MSSVSGSFWVGMVIDGDKLDGNLRTTVPLFQFYKADTESCIPDWTVPANQPIIYPVLRSQNEGMIKPIVTGTDKWYYNGVQITFGANNLATAPAVVAGKIKKVTHNNGSLNVPAVQIVSNLASQANVDADIIRMVANVESSGHTLDFEAFITMKIAEYSDSEYVGFLDVNNGGIIDKESGTLKVTPTLYKGGSKMTGGYTVKWLKPPYTSSFSTAASVTLKRDDIDSRLNLMCQFIVEGAVVDTRIITLSDEIDPYFVACESSGTTMLESTGANSSVTMTYKVKKQGTGDVITGYTFNTIITGSKGQVITLENPPYATGCKIVYADALKAGGNLTGNVTAVKS